MLFRLPEVRHLLAIYSSHNTNTYPSSILDLRVRTTCSVRIDNLENGKQSKAKTIVKHMPRTMYMYAVCQGIPISFRRLRVCSASCRQDRNTFCRRTERCWNYCFVLLLSHLSALYSFNGITTQRETPQQPYHSLSVLYYYYCTLAL